MLKLASNLNALLVSSVKRHVRASMIWWKVNWGFRCACPVREMNLIPHIVSEILEHALSCGTEIPILLSLISDFKLQEDPVYLMSVYLGDGTPRPAHRDHSNACTHTSYLSSCRFFCARRHRDLCGSWRNLYPEWQKSVSSPEEFLRFGGEKQDFWSHYLQKYHFIKWKRKTRIW